MLRCSICGASNDVLYIMQYTIRGYDDETEKPAKRKVNICQCCSAWGMDTKEKLYELAGIHKR